MRSNEQGFSIIELLIATGIIGILLALYTNSQPRLERDAAMQAAKEDGRDELILVLNLIRKNVKSKLADTSVELVGNGFQFSQKMTDGSIQQIKMLNRCRAINGESFTVVAKDQTDADCLAKLDCHGLPYLEVQQQDSAGQILSKVFPSQRNFEQNIKKKAGFGGLGLCIDKQSDSLKIRAFEVLFSRHDSGSTKLVLDGMSYQMLDQARNSIEMIR